MTLVPVPVIRFLDKGNEIIGLQGILPAGVIIITNIESGFFWITTGNSNTWDD